MKAVPVIIPSVFPIAVTDAFMRVTPLLQAAIDVLFVGVETSPRCNRSFNARCDRHLLDVGQHPHDHLTATLDHPKDRRLLSGQRPPPACAFESSAPPLPPFFTTSSGLPL